jgi:hypothetical protein
MFPRRKHVVLRGLALLVLIAISVQMAVCLTEDQSDSSLRDNTSIPFGSDCSCHDCGCCSLHVGFPPQVQSCTTFLIQTVCSAPAPRVLAKANPRLERPPRS